MSVLLRCAACTLVAIGCGCWLAAADSVSWAVECEPSEYSPAVCESAHEDNGGSYSGGLCGFDELGNCVPLGRTGCSVGGGFGIALPGHCRQLSAGSEAYYCTENYGVTIVQLHQWRAYCDDSYGSCSCVIEIDAEAGVANVEVCDCQHEEL